MHFPEVLVLGATGRIGTILRKCWPGRAKTVLWQSRIAQPGAGWCVLDPLADPAALGQAARGRGVILCLAGAVPGRSADMADNIALAEAAVRAGAEAGARVLLASSAAVYGHAEGVLKETAPLAPVSDYGRAKAEMETRAAGLGADLGGTVTCLRIGNVAGVDAILGGWRPGFQLDRFDDGRTPRRSYIGPATLARVLGDLVTAADLPPVLNLAAPNAIEMGALLDAAHLDWTPRRPDDSAIAEVQLSTAALERITPFAPENSQPAGMVREWRELGSDIEGMAKK